MSLHEQIEPELSGDAKHIENRKALLRIITDAFAKEGQELVTSELASEMDAIAEQFDTELAKLRAKL